eukprot:SAG25_NODE_6299_length_571_cov_0.963983_1_plen_77_part_10
MPSLGGVWGSKGMMNIKGTGRFLEDLHTSQQVSNRSNIIQRTSCSRTCTLFTTRVDVAQDDRPDESFGDREVKSWPP